MQATVTPLTLKNFVRATEARNSSSAVAFWLFFVNWFLYRSKRTEETALPEQSMNNKQNKENLQLHVKQINARKNRRKIQTRDLSKHDCFRT